MFKKILMALGAFMLLLIVLFVVIGGHGEKKVAEFFTRVRAGSATDVEGMISPELKQMVDAELMTEFVKHVATDYGEFKSVRANGMRFETKYADGHTVSELEGTYVFEKKEIHLEVDFRDDRLSGFIVKDKEAAKEILARLPATPRNSKSYEKRGDEFLRALIQKKADVAWGLIHEVLQKQLGRQTFDKQIASLPDVKAIESIEVKAARPEKGDPSTLEIIYRCKFDGQEVPAHVGFQFANLQGHLVSFGLPSRHAE